MLLPYAFFSQHKTKQKKNSCKFYCSRFMSRSLYILCLCYSYRNGNKKNFSSFLNHVFKISNKKQKNPFNPYLPRSLIGLISLEFLYAL